MGFTLRFILGTLLILCASTLIRALEEKVQNKTLEDALKPKPEDKQNTVSNLQKTETYKKAAESARAIDIEKFVSKDFHNKNNIYTVSHSPDTEKFLNPDFLHETTHEDDHVFSYNSELTTPKSSIFDQKFRDTVASVDQELGHIDDEEEEEAEELRHDVDLDKLVEETKRNDTKADLNYINFKNITKNDEKLKNALHKDLVVEDGTNLDFKSSYNRTTVIDDDDDDENGNNTIVKESSTISNVIPAKGDLDNSESVTVKTTLLSTTRKNIIITKPPSVKNSSHISILSNKIETETIKAVNPISIVFSTTERVKEESETISEIPPLFNPTTFTSTVDKKIVIQETENATTDNKIIAQYTENSTTNTKITPQYTENSTTNNKITTQATENSTTELPVITTDQETTVSSTEETEMITQQTESATTDSSADKETTKNVITESTTDHDEFTTWNVFTTTNKEVVTTEVTTRSEEETTTSETETMTSVITETSASPWERLTDATTLEVETTTSEATTSGEVSTTTEAIYLSDGTVATVAIPEIQTATVSLEITTMKEIITTTEEPTTRVVINRIVTPDKIEETTLMGRKLQPSETEITTASESVTSDYYEHTDPPEDKSGTIIAITISTVGGVCLVLLAVLLVVMRKRQKRFNYGQRCRPVSLDDYSMDNVSTQNSVRRKGMVRSSKRSYGNPAFEDPSSVSHPLNFPALGKFSNNFEDINSEFEEIPVITARTTELPEGCDTKNRYANVIPLPETRVFLKLIDGYPNSDYINANYVTGPKNTKGFYIASQAPLQNTVDDFWRMIWEQEVKVVLMLTHFFENGVEKCVDYLPPSEVLDCHRLFGDFQVTLKKREVKEKYIISSLQLKNMVSNCWREVTHFWYMGWPEKGVPIEANSLIAYLIEARSYMKSSSLDRKNENNGNLNNGAAKNELNPVVVHCSPGTGRTGVVIACDIAIREFEQNRLVDIPKIVYRIRRDRASAVQTKDQYAFIYKVISLYATKLAGGVLDSL